MRGALLRGREVSEGAGSGGLGLREGSWEGCGEDPEAEKGHRPHPAPGGRGCAVLRAPGPLQAAVSSTAADSGCAAPPAGARGARAGASGRDGPCQLPAVKGQNFPGCALPGSAALPGSSDVLSPTGALISHDKLLLQTNPERELGSMSYQLGQVSPAPSPVLGFGPLHLQKQS